MSQESVEIVRRGFEAWNRRDYEAALSHFSSDVQIDVSDRILNPEVYTGIDGAIRFRNEIAETWDDFRVEVEDLLPAGEEVVALVRSSGQGRMSGAPVVNAGAAWVATVREGKIARLRLYRERSEALEAVGLGE